MSDHITNAEHYQKIWLALRRLEDADAPGANAAIDSLCNIMAEVFGAAAQLALTARWERDLVGIPPLLNDELGWYDDDVRQKLDYQLFRRDAHANTLHDLFMALLEFSPDEGVHPVMLEDLIHRYEPEIEQLLVEQESGLLDVDVLKKLREVVFAHALLDHPDQVERWSCIGLEHHRRSTGPWRYTSLEWLLMGQFPVAFVRLARAAKEMVRHRE